MIQDIAPIKYENHYENLPPRDTDWLMVYNRNEVLCKIEDGMISYMKVGDVNKDEVSLTYLFSMDEERFFLLNDPLTEIPEGFTWQKQPIFREVKPKHLAYAGVTGMSLYSWYRDNKFCGRCGKPMTHDGKERMMRCECGNMVFPKICPGIIVGVLNGDKILLTKYNRRGVVNYSLVAGFTEIGETLEETVQREVMEEVGLKVKNIRYYTNQPWTFSSSLLVGFFCDVDGDTTVKLDTDELALGQWFTRDEIPQEDDGISMTRQMIALFKAGKI